MGDRFDQAIDFICEGVNGSLTDFEIEKVQESVDLLKEAKQIFVYGAGRSGLVGRTFAMRLMQLGLRAFFIGETITPAVNDDDCVFFVSRTGETQTAIQAAEIVSDLVKAKIIVLTASPDSTLAGYGDITLVIDIEEDKDKPMLAPLGTIFEDSAMIFLDAFIAVMIDELGETEEEMKVRHPILV